MTTEIIFGVRYDYVKLPDGSDLYVTVYGQPLIEALKPENYLTDRKWFDHHSVKLGGTADPYRITTKNVGGVSTEIVFKWNRMGQKVISEEEDEVDLSMAEFNSPFEEFSLVMELRNSRFGELRNVKTQRPLAIYVPLEPAELWQVGRKEHKMKALYERHEREVQLDIHREYAVIYEWLPGIDAAQACREGLLTTQEMIALNDAAKEELERRGFIVRDSKPHHIIVRPTGNGKRLRLSREGQVAYGLVDFELLERTPERYQMVKRLKRSNYLKRQKDRFNVNPQIPEHLKAVNIFGVDYIFGHAGSTTGLLWVVGRDPELFDYFQPERWENTQRVQLSPVSRVYYTLTKDNVHLVWRISKVGVIPDMDPFKSEEKTILEYGYNSPFEEISIALEITRKGLRTTYPRAIYMMGNRSSISGAIYDPSRYQSHAGLIAPDGEPILRQGRNYTIIWGYWNGPDERLATVDGDYLEAINALRAYRERYLTESEYLGLIHRKKERLLRIGIEDLNMGGTHILLSKHSSGRLLRDDEGHYEARICNFELLRRLPSSSGSG